MAANTDPEKKEKAKAHAAKDKQKESLYTAAELAADAETIFNTTPECVLAALKEKGLGECTKREAEETVKAFRERTVK